MSDARAGADTLRGILRVTIGGEERQLRKLKLHPAEEWFDRHAKALGPLAQLDPADLEGDLVKTVQVIGNLAGALVAAIADYDSEGTLGGADQLANDLYPDELLPLFLELRDAALPFVELLRDHRAPGAVGSRSTSSTSGPTPTGATTPTRSGTASTRASSKRSGRPVASA